MSLQIPPQMADIRHSRKDRHQKEHNKKCRLDVVIPLDVPGEHDHYDKHGEGSERKVHNGPGVIV